MKRFIAILLVFSMIFSLSGCYISKEQIVDSVKDEVSKEIDNAIDRTKEEVSNKVNEAVDNAKMEISQKVDDAIDGVKTEVGQIADELPRPEDIVTESTKAEETEKSWIDNLKGGIDDILGRDMTITFQPNGGTGGPTEQRFRGGDHVLIVNETPTREGYHFVGWTRQEGTNEPQFFAGKWTSHTFTQDTTLYACWEKYNFSAPFTVHANMGETLNFGGVFELIGGSAGVKTITIEHNYHLKKQNNGKVIRIQCDCGFELIDRDISLDNFVAIKSKGENKSYDSLKASKASEFYKEYILYRTLDFAPTAIALISSFYETFESDMQSFDPNNKKTAKISNHAKHDALFSTFDELGEMLEFASEFDLAYANSEYAQEFVDLKWTHYDHYEDYTIAYLLREMRPEDTNALLRESKTLFFTRAAKLGKGSSHAISLARAVYYGYDAYASNEMASTKCISMVKAIHSIINYCPIPGLDKYYDQLFTVLEEGLVLYDKCCKEKNSFYEFLSAILLDDGSAIKGTTLTLEHIDRARNNNFDGAPSVMELLDSLLSHTSNSKENYYSLLSKNQKNLVIWYITMRLEYDFETEFGISLEKYMEYVK